MADVKTIPAENERLSHELLRANADQIDQARRFPRENLQALGKAGVLGLLIPAQYGGVGGGLAEMSQVLDAQAQNCGSTAMVTLMHYCATAAIAAKGSDALKSAPAEVCQWRRACSRSCYPIFKSAWPPLRWGWQRQRIRRSWRA